MNPLPPPPDPPAGEGAPKTLEDLLAADTGDTRLEQEDTRDLDELTAQRSHQPSVSPTAQPAASRTSLPTRFARQMLMRRGVALPRGSLAALRARLASKKRPAPSLTALSPSVTLPPPPPPPLPKHASEDFSHPTSPHTAPNADESTPLPRHRQGTQISTPTTPSSTKSSQNSPLIRPVRTIHDDLRRVIQEQELTPLKAVALAEEQRAHAPPAQDTPSPAPKWEKRDVFLLVAAVIFLVGGSVLGVWALLSISQPPLAPRPLAERLPRLFTADITRTLEVAPHAQGNTILSSLARLRQNVSLRLGSVLALYPVQREAEGVRLLSPQEWFRRIGAHVDPPLAESLSVVVVGFHGNAGTPAFLAFGVRAYEEALRGMLAWEPYLVADLAPLLAVPLPPQDAQHARFVDTTIHNLTVRILRDPLGVPLLVYGFPTQTSLVITTSESTYLELARRIREAEGAGK